MIPRLRPSLDSREILALAGRQPDAVPLFERAFAQTFGCAHGVAFPYGRSGLWALLKSLDLSDAEVILPAYTCSTVAHAVVLSGNVPCFVDIDLSDYNMALDDVERSITAKTRVIIATHLFGYPLNLDHLRAIVRDAEARWRQKIWIVQDCAHSFDARWKGASVCAAPDVALFGLNISKTITSIFGGMITTNNPDIDRRLRSVRDGCFTARPAIGSLERGLYLLAALAAFTPSVYGVVHWLANHTPALDRLTRSYHLDERIHFPPDYLRLLTPLEARVGLVQLRKYADIVDHRRATAAYYDSHLQHVLGLTPPPLVDGATYSHYTVRVQDRPFWLTRLARAGVELGQVIDYVVPRWPAYRRYADRAFPKSIVAMREVMNLPVHTGVDVRERERIVDALRRSAAEFAAGSLRDATQQPTI